MYTHSGPMYSLYTLAAYKENDVVTGYYLDRISKLGFRSCPEHTAHSA